MNMLASKFIWLGGQRIAGLISKCLPLIAEMSGARTRSLRRSYGAVYGSCDSDGGDDDDDVDVDRQRAGQFGESLRSA